MRLYVWFDIDMTSRFDLFLPLHVLWMDYMSELLALPRKPATAPSSEAAAKAMPHASGMHPKLLKADFHGSIMTGIYPLIIHQLGLTIFRITVSQSKNPCIVGISGIVIHETENAFKVITRENKVKSKPSHSLLYQIGFSTLFQCFLNGIKYSSSPCRSTQRSPPHTT